MAEERKESEWKRPIEPRVLMLIFKTKTLGTEGQTKEATDAFKAVTKIGEKAVPELNSLLADKRVPDWVKKNSEKVLETIQKQIAVKH